ncbi:MAG: class I tRNA ligase family protein, partial [Burkholderiales bacterium]|nr:class I tRNA ligase family protein [Burkholderiales bacterium]
KMLNALESFKNDGSAGRQAALAEALNILLRCLYPVAPHVTHALWRQLGLAARHGELLDAPWPEVDPRALEQDEIELVLQVNGKLRGAVRVPANASREAIERIAVHSEAFLKVAEGAKPKKVVVVPGRLVNVVI